MQWSPLHASADQCEAFGSGHVNRIDKSNDPSRLFQPFY